MKKLLKIEIKKAIKNKWFFIALAIGCTITTISAVNNIILDIEFGEIGFEYATTKYTPLTSSSSYKYWIVNDFIQPTTDLFFVLLPLLAVLPYSWSYASEAKSGYFQHVLTRTSRYKYFSSKGIAAFLSGALVVSIPIILNFVLCAYMVPSYLPDVSEIIYFGVFTESLWSDIFYNQPFMYVLLYTGLIFLFSGLWATATSFLALFFKNRIGLMVVPYLFLFFLKYLNENTLNEIIQTSISPLNYLRAVNSFFPDGYLILAELLILLGFIIISLGLIKKRDIL